jgi:hypothetical protein
MKLHDQKAVKKIIQNQVVKSTTAIVHSVDCDRVNITLGNTSALVRGVEVVGDAKKIIPGSSLPLVWRDGRPIVLQASAGVPLPSAALRSPAKTGAFAGNVRLDIPAADIVSAVSLIYKINTAQYSNGWLELFGCAVNDYLEWTFLIDTGTYLMRTLCLSAIRFGIFQIYLDGIYLDEKDLYTATTVYNLSWDVPITIKKGGAHKVRLVSSGKNASATAYTLAANWISICPTPS